LLGIFMCIVLPPDKFLLTSIFHISIFALAIQFKLIGQKVMFHLEIDRYGFYFSTNVSAIHG